MISSILWVRSRVSRSPIVFIWSPVFSAINFHSIVAQCIPIFQVHETQARGTFDGTGIEQDRRHLGLAVHLVKEHRHRSEEHTSELQSLRHLVCRLLLE